MHDFQQSSGRSSSRRALVVITLVATIAACVSDRLVAPRGPLPAVPAGDLRLVRFVKFDLGAASPPATVRLSNNGGVALGEVGASTAYLGGRSGWLTVDVVNRADTNGATVTITPAFAPAAQGAADSAIIILSGTGGTRTDTITVTGQVLPGAKLGFSAPRLTFAADTAATTPQQGILTVQNIGNGGPDLGVITPVIAPAKSWLAIAPTAPAGYFALTMNPSGQPAGNDSTWVRFTSPRTREADSVPVFLSVGNPILLVSGTDFSNVFSGVSVGFGSDSGGTVSTPASFVDGTIVNGGSGALGSLSVDQPVYLDGSGGWLTVSLSGNTLHIVPNAGKLPPRRYDARVTVRASGGGGLSTNVFVGLTIVPAAPRRLVLSTRQLEISGTKVNCSLVPANWPCSSPTTGSSIITFTNGGGGGSIPFAIEGAYGVTYSSGQPTGWLSVQPGSSFTGGSYFSINGPNLDSLPLGVFTAKAWIAFPSIGLSDTVSVRAVVLQGSPPADSGASVGIPSAIGFQGSGVTANTVGFTVYTGSSASLPLPDPLTITIVNSGNGQSLGPLSLGQVQYQSGQPGGWLTVSPLNGTTAPATFTLTVGNVAAIPNGGPYTAVLPVGSGSGLSGSLVVNLAVTPVPRLFLPKRSFVRTSNPCINGYSVVQITNLGGGRLNLSTQLSYASLGPISFSPSQPTEWLLAFVDPFPWVGIGQFRCDSGRLPTVPGDYTATIVVRLNALPATTAPETIDTIRMTFRVLPPPLPAILRLSAQNVTLAGLAGDTAHARFTVAAFNSGTGSLGVLSTEPVSYNPTDSPTWLTATATAGGVDLDANPAGLVPDSTYQARVTLRASGADSTARLTVEYRLNQPVQALATPLISFGVDTLRLSYSRASGGTGALSDTVAVSDARQSTLPLLGLRVGLPSYTGANGWVAGAFLGSTTAPTSLAVAVNGKNLPVGTYVATLPVSASDTAIQVRYLPVRLVVDP